LSSPSSFDPNPPVFAPSGYSRSSTDCTRSIDAYNQF
jgi:hypothetical protein